MYSVSLLGRSRPMRGIVPFAYAGNSSYFVIWQPMPDKSPASLTAPGTPDPGAGLCRSLYAGQFELLRYMAPHPGQILPHR